MELFRVSFSILEPWSKGDYDTALQRYYHKEVQPTEAMIEGKILHKKWEQEINTTGKLPKVFGDMVLDHPETELKITMIIDKWIQFVGVIDCIEGHTIYDWKTGRSGVQRYASSWQPRCYQALADANGYAIDTAMILFHNQHEQFVQKGKIYLNEKTKNDAIEFIRTYSSEMKDALDKTENHD